MILSELDYLIEELWSAIDSEDQVMSEYWSKLIDDHIGEEK
jgi:hypothetical protein